MVIQLSVLNFYRPVNSINLKPDYININSRLYFTTNVVSNQLIRELESSLPLSHGVTTDRSLINLSVGHTLNIYSLVNKVPISLSVNDLLFHYQSVQVPKWEIINSNVNLANDVAFSISSPINSNLTFSQTIIAKVIRPIVVNQTLLLINGVAGWVADPNTILNEPYIGDLDKVYFAKQHNESFKLYLPRPELGEVYKNDFTRISRRSRGGDLLISRDNIWPKEKSFNMQFSGLKQSQINDVLALIKETLGKTLHFHNYDDVQWDGFITNPQTEAIQIGRDNFSINIEFDGSTIPISHRELVQFLLLSQNIDLLKKYLREITNNNLLTSNVNYNAILNRLINETIALNQTIDKYIIHTNNTINSLTLIQLINLNNSLVRSKSDNLLLTQLLNEYVVHNRSTNNNLLLTSNFNYLASFVRSINNNLTLNENILNYVIHNRSTNNNLLLIQSIGLNTILNRSQINSLLLTQLLNEYVVHNRSTNVNLSLTSNVSYLANFYRLVEDISLSLNQTINNYTIHNRPLIDNLTLTESIINYVIHTNSLVNNLLLVSSLSRNVNYTRSFNNSLINLQTISNFVIHTRSASNNLVLSTLATNSHVTNSPVSSTLTLSQLITKGNSTFLRTVINTNTKWQTINAQLIDSVQWINSVNHQTNSGSSSVNQAAANQNNYFLIIGTADQSGGTLTLSNDAGVTFAVVNEVGWAHGRVKAWFARINSTSNHTYTVDSSVSATTTIMIGEISGQNVIVKESLTEAGLLDSTVNVSLTQAFFTNSNLLYNGIAYFNANLGTSTVSPFIVDNNIAGSVLKDGNITNYATKMINGNHDFLTVNLPDSHGYISVLLEPGNQNPERTISQTETFVQTFSFIIVHNRTVVSSYVPVSTPIEHIVTQRIISQTNPFNQLILAIRLHLQTVTSNNNLSQTVNQQAIFNKSVVSLINFSQNTNRTFVDQESITNNLSLTSRVNIINSRTISDNLSLTSQINKLKIGIRTITTNLVRTSSPNRQVFYKRTINQPISFNEIYLQDALPLQIDEIKFRSAVTDSTYGYFAGQSGKIVKINLSSFSRVAGLTVSGVGDFASGVIDTINGFAYFGTSDIPGKIVKIKLSDFTYVSTLTLNSGDDNLTTAVIDPANGFAYFGANFTNPGRIIKINLSSFSRVSHIVTNTGVNTTPIGSTIDLINGFAYFSVPIERVMQIDLSTFTHTTQAGLSSGETPSTILGLDNTYIYVATNTSPAKVVRINKSTLIRDSAINLSNGTSPFASTIHSNFMYIYCRDSNRIIKINLTTFAEDSFKETDPNISYFTCISDNNFVYFGSYITQPTSNQGYIIRRPL